MLVLARVTGPTWRGQHVAMHVDNYALVPAFRKGRGKTARESDKVREIALLQATQAWTWEVTWIPRALNEAADTLSKNDMLRFWANVGGTRVPLQVRPEHLRLPRAQDSQACHARPKPESLRGSGRPRAGQADVHRPHRDVLLPAPQSGALGLWGHLTRQVQQ